MKVVLDRPQNPVLLRKEMIHEHHLTLSMVLPIGEHSFCVFLMGMRYQYTSVVPHAFTHSWVVFTVQTARALINGFISQNTANPSAKLNLSIYVNTFKALCTHVSGQGRSLWILIKKAQFPDGIFPTYRDT